MLTQWLHGTLDLLFPRNCILCRKFHPATRRDPVCPSCRSRVPFIRPPFCNRCGRHLSVFSADGTCAACRRRSPGFDSAWVITRYAAPMPELIGAFKFRDKTSLRRTFDHLIAEFFRHLRTAPRADALLPIPLHPARLRERGYNQAQLLAEALGHRFRIPVREDILLRNEYRPPQHALGRKERWTNIQGAFRINGSWPASLRSVIIVDDLLTTGATATAAARTLKTAGAAHVDLIALAAA